MEHGNLLPFYWENSLLDVSGSTLLNTRRMDELTGTKQGWSQKGTPKLMELTTKGRLHP